MRERGPVEIERMTHSRQGIHDNGLAPTVPDPPYTAVGAGGAGAGAGCGGTGGGNNGGELLQQLCITYDSK